MWEHSALGSWDLTLPANAGVFSASFRGSSGLPDNSIVTE